MKVRIYKPTRTAMQSGRAKTDNWVLEYETKSGRGPETLMGWTQSNCTLNQVKMNFETQEEAIRFAEEKGWSYSVKKPRERKVVPRNYGDNFKFIPPESA